MHLSLISDAYLSDAMNDAGRGADAGRPAGADHHEALLRGVAMLVVAGLLLGLTFVASAVRSADRDDAPPPFSQAAGPTKIFSRIAPQS